MANTGNTQQQINYGASANDGQGDPLRNAFIKTNNNFNNIWLAGPVGSNITITNNTVQVNDTNGNLILSPNGVGVIQTNSRLLPRLNNTYDLGSTTLKYRTGYFGEGGIVTQGNIAADYFVGNGSQLTGIVAVSSYGNANVATYLSSGTVSGNIITTGNVSGNYFVGNGALLTGISAVSSYGNANVVANLAALGANPITSTANISGNYFIGNGSQLTGITAVSSYGNANVANYLPTYTGHLSGNRLEITNIGNTWSMVDGALNFPTGALWYSDIATNDEFISSNVDGYLNFQTFDNTSNVATELHMEHGLIHINIYNGSLKQWEFNEDGTTHLPGDLLPQANLGGNLGNQQYQWNDLWVSNNTIYINSVPVSLTVANVLTVNGQPVLSNDSDSTVTTTGNITANYFFGNGSQLTGVAASTGNVTFDDVNIIGTGNLNLQPDAGNSEYLNIYLTGAADIHIAADGAGPGNVILGTDEGSNVAVLWEGNVAIQAGNVGGTQTWTFDTAGNLTLPGNTFAVNYANGDPVTIGGGGGGNATLPLANGTSNFDIAAADGNATITANASSTWTFDTAGNLTLPGNTFAVNYANGDPVTIGSGDYGNSNVADYLASNAAVVIAVTGNITTTGNIEGAYVLGNGSQLTGLPANYGNSDVADYLASNAAVVIAVTGNITTTGNVSGAYVLGNGSELTNLPAPTVTQDITSNGAMSIMTYDGVIKYVSYATVEPISGNIAAGNISAAGNIQGTYILGDGSFLTGISTANIGNVTFNDINIIGTGNLHLQPDPANSSAYLDIYLTGGSDIHIAGNGETVILGTDDFANVTIGVDGNVRVQASTGTPQTWEFDTTGNLTTPQGMIISGNVNFLGTNTALLKPADNIPLTLFTSGASGAVTSFWTEDAGNVMTSNIAAIYTPVPGTGNVRIVAGNNAGYMAIYDFGNDGITTLPTVANESARLVGTRKVVGGLTATAPYSVTLAAGGTPTVAYTSLPGTSSVKVTFAVQSNGAGFQWEQFDVVAVESQDSAGTANFVVSNRVKGNLSIPDTAVTAAMSGTQIQISLNLDVSQTSGGWSSFDAVEFGLMVD